ncbi:hypothetical protein FJZ39_02020 [Candidatus Saccharibacteria bacterium]|nr:hypothetical protein [Candidatus Saccharibacteria bacterium]
MTARHAKQSGAVSIFIVIFAAMLLLVMTMSYVRLMMREQLQANDNDLSQSAYDSALSGVEDAKRVLAECNSNNATACAAIAAGQCSTVNASGILGAVRGEAEVPIQSTGGSGRDLDQAHTCVIIAPDTPDYLATLNEEVSTMIPLKATGAVRYIQVEWYRQSASEGRQALTRPPIGTTNRTLPEKANWGANSPSLLRAQLINPGENFRLNELNASGSASTGETQFIQPGTINATEQQVAAQPSIGQFYTRMSDDSIGDSVGERSAQPLQAACSSARYNNGQYACSVRLQLPDGDTVASGSETAFLRLSALYRGADIRVTLYDDAQNPVSFDGVQPRVDSTGRTNDIFRRVEARLQYGGDFAYPEAALEVSGSLCKDFDVEDAGVTPGLCRPN